MQKPTLKKKLMEKKTTMLRSEQMNAVVVVFSRKRQADE